MVEIPPGHAAHALGATTTRRRGDERRRPARSRSTASS